MTTMKTKSVILAAAALTALISCSKDDSYKDVAAEKSEDFKIISASFENSDDTKTTLDGLYPLWADGDKIMVMNGTDYHEVTLETNTGVPEDKSIGYIHNDGKSFAFIVPSSWETIYAVYPASCANGTTPSGNNIQITIPAEQDGTFASANICIAKSESTELNFKNATSVFKVVQTAGAHDCVYFTASDNLSGNFTATLSESGVTLATNGSNTRTIKGTIPENAEIAYYAANPATIASATPFSMKVAKTGTKIFAAKDYTSTITMAVNKIYKFGATSFAATDYKMAGPFSVDDSSTPVFFSLGNMYYDRTATKYYIEANQYDFRYYSYASGTSYGTGVINGASKTTPSKTVGSFSWGTTISQLTDRDGTVTGSSNDFFITNKNATTPSSNFSVVIADNTETGIWRILSGGTSGGEWEYLLVTRTGNRYAQIKINATATICGLLIFPDGLTEDQVTWTWPSNVNTTLANYDKVTNYTSDDFLKLQNSGCVFLPAAGYMTTTNVSNQSKRCNYWSSVPYVDKNAYRLLVQSDGSANLEPGTNYKGRQLGMDARLVRK